ncbi:MAG: c-type cytochrome [Solirubrobacterales bacterium]
MSKKPFVVFGLVLVLLAVLIPLWAFMSAGDPARGRMEVPENLKAGQTGFEDNCGNCHKLYAAGTDGDYGPDLDQKLAPAGTPEGPDAAAAIKGTKDSVLNTLEQGVDDPTVPGRMPAGIVTGPVAEEIAEFVAATAGRG